MIGKMSLNAFPRAFRLESAWSEHGRNDVESQRVNFEHGNRMRHRSFTRLSVFLDISDRSLAHISFFFIPERLQR